MKDYNEDALKELQERYFVFPETPHDNLIEDDVLGEENAELSRSLPNKRPHTEELKWPLSPIANKLRSREFKD